MERNYKPNKNLKLQNLFLCQKQIQSLKSKVLSLIQLPCQNFYQQKKNAVTTEVNKQRNSSSKSKSKSKKSKTSQNKNANLTMESESIKNKKILCPCNSHQIQQTPKKQKNFKFASPQKQKKRKIKHLGEVLTKNSSSQTSLKYKHLKTESTAQNQHGLTSRSKTSSQQNHKASMIKKTNSFSLSLDENTNVNTPKRKNKGDFIKIEPQESHLQLSEVKPNQRFQQMQSSVSPLNSKYFKPCQESRFQISKNPAFQDHKSFESLKYQQDQQAFYMDEQSYTSLMKKPLQSQNQFMSTGMTAVKKLPFTTNKEVTETKIQTERSQKNFLETDLSLNLIKKICQKTQRFVSDQIYPFKQIFRKNQASFKEALKKQHETKPIQKVSNFGLWINDQNESDQN